MNRFSDGKILAFCGTMASALGMTGGYLLPFAPRTGAFISGTAGAIMLIGNITVLSRNKKE